MCIFTSHEMWNEVVYRSSLAVYPALYLKLKSKQRPPIVLVLEKLSGPAGKKFSYRSSTFISKSQSAFHLQLSPFLFFPLFADTCLNLVLSLS